MARGWQAYIKKEGTMKKKRFKAYLATLAFITLGLVLIRPTSHEDLLVKVAAKSLPKTVMIHVAINMPIMRISIAGIELFRSTETTTQHFLGSGAIISPNGHILTCAHLFNEGDVQSVDVKSFNGDEQRAEILFVDNSRDLALIQINSYTPQYARLANSDKLKVGQEVIAIGYPLGLEFSVTYGVISYLHRQFDDRHGILQTDTSINPGNSGGPLFNLKGELVGINSFIISPVKAPIFTGCGFSIESGQITEFLERFKGL